jgi:hypothetical protein
VQIPLGKSNLDFGFPESAVNFLMELTFYLQSFFGIQYPDAKLEIERALSEFQK